MEHLIDNIYTIVEAMASMYDLENTSLKDFIKDVRQCRALHNFLMSNLKERNL